MYFVEESGPKICTKTISCRSSFQRLLCCEFMKNAGGIFKDFVNNCRKVNLAIIFSFIEKSEVTLQILKDTTNILNDCINFYNES